MRRLFVIFLILLLPLQVFAGVVEDRMALSQYLPVQQSQLLSASESKPAPSTLSFQSPSGEWSEIQLNSTAANDNTDKQNSSGDDSSGDDFVGHAAFGDDAVLTSFLIFSVQSPDFISTLHNDAASVPPYLPPAARPPKI
ncbi:hypothetical protein D9O50_04470 [Oxalobacteraceae bacterium CAVE-383]|nr:hypothetical protein D9O50_04470 [Oxalobacteraceae bacterium CAVE-383]